MEAAWLRWIESGPEFDTPPRRAHDAGQFMWKSALSFAQRAGEPPTPESRSRSDRRRSASVGTFDQQLFEDSVAAQLLLERLTDEQLDVLVERAAYVWRCRFPDRDLSQHAQ